ncbi:ATP-binding protein [Thiolapillus brandeum]|uniref:histidine kinase n=1 Tax=Thiolapillus brandeum TaxID=1076588 RepID=A0A7U6GJ41_9GAMM|nr:ATP-binding protein [Thiolapillus brandeum]BAO44626.1 two-component system OmpR family sensor histidine kinase [Thiolapillus brandeum]
MKKRAGIRFKLLLVSLSLLAIPWAGYRFIQEMAYFLRDAQEQNLETTARALATLVRGSNSLPADASPEAFYLHTSAQPVVLDGYTEDWQELLPLAQSLKDNPQPASLLLQAQGKQFYLLLQVVDHDLIYFNGPFVRYGVSDQVLLRMLDANGVTREWLIAPQAPGNVSAYRLSGKTPGPRDQRLEGQWQETSRGYNLELQLPADLATSGMGLQILDPNPGPLPARETPDSIPAILPLIRPSAPLGSLLADNLPPHSRIRVLDSQGWVLASAGNLAPAPPGGDSTLPWIIRKLLNLALRHHSDDHLPIGAHQTRLEMEPVASALSGRGGTRRYQLPGSETLVMATALPITTPQGVARGVVLLEQTTDSILSLQNQAMQRLLGITLALFAVVSLALLGFASLLTRRIRRLHQQMESAVAADGRIIGSIKTPAPGDEIADLGRGFANMLNRLQEYNRYLQAMASRLSHEFRTPLAIIRSSLENSAEVKDAGEKQAYLQRALKGVDRLELILRQLQEATRLEKALQQVEVQEFELCGLLEITLENYRGIHPDLDFRLCRCSGIKVQGAPELIFQALEKLLDNAIDFHQADTAIELSVEERQNQVWICVSNRGPTLPPDMDLFQSMISVRRDTRQQPHLGLGLYLVKLIAEFHGGSARAENLPQQNGARFCFSLLRRQ